MLKICCGLFSIVLLLPAATARGELVAASNKRLPTTNSYFHTGAGISDDNGAVYDNREMQTFLALNGGAVQHVSFTAHQSSGTTAPMRVDIMTVIGDQPANSLGYAIVPISAFPPNSTDPAILNIAAEFSTSGALISAGTTYAIVFSSELPNANYRLYGVTESKLAPGDRYLAGTNAFSQNGRPYSSSLIPGDLYFEVTVNPVPEPASLVLACAGSCLALVAFRRKRAAAPNHSRVSWRTNAR